MIKTVRNADDFFSCPLTQLLGKCLAGSYGAIRPMNRLAREKTLYLGVRPDAVIFAGAKIAKEISRRVQRISGKKDLRQRRFAQSKVPRRDQYIRAALAYQPPQHRLFLPKTARRIGL